MRSITHVSPRGLVPPGEQEAPVHEEEYESTRSHIRTVTVRATYPARGSNWHAP